MTQNKEQEQEYTSEDIATMAESIAEEIFKKTQTVDIKSLKDIVAKSLNAKESQVAVSEALGKLNDVEELVYGASISKIEIKMLLRSLPEAKGSFLRKRVADSLTQISDCYMVLKSRYDHMTVVLTGIRSINSAVKSHVKF